MKAVVLGRGFLGQEFERQGFTVYGRDKFLAEAYDVAVLDEFDVIINCIAKTDTRWCEDKANIDTVLQVNSFLPGRLSQYCQKFGKKFVHISTGCLYEKQNSAESSFLAAHCLYTVSKWAGEAKLQPDDLIIRPRLFYSPIHAPNNFLVKLPAYKRYVWDQLDSFTLTEDVPKAVNALLKAEQSGTFNVCSQGSASVWQLACFLMDEKLPHTTIDQVRSEQDLHLVNCTMNTDKLEEYFMPSELWSAMARCWDALYN